MRGGGGCSIFPSFSPIFSPLTSVLVQLAPSQLLSGGICPLPLPSPDLTGAKPLLQQKPGSHSRNPRVMKSPPQQCSPCARCPMPFSHPLCYCPRPPLCVTAASLKALLIAVLTCIRCSVKTTLPANVFRDLHVRSKLFPRAALGASSALAMRRGSKLACLNVFWKETAMPWSDSLCPVSWRKGFSRVPLTRYFGMIWME